MISAASSAADFFLEKTVADSKYWKLLLHYRNGKSEADGAEFFLSPTGNKDPLSELVADVAAFTNPDATRVGNLKQHPQCAFPERYRFLKQELKLEIKEQECPDFSQWKRSFREESVSVVYAAPYLGSPASMFGHTFLRIGSKVREGQKQKNDLLDYTIGFEAHTGDASAAAYALYGVFGFYPGLFSQTPYFLKINTYTSMESRDLWEYELNLNEDQMSRFINHIWETGTTYFNYYFFNGNCSYHLLSLLEVANPDWDLRNQFGLTVVPVNTIRALTETPGTIRKISVRPSILRGLQLRLGVMSEKEKQDFYSAQRDVKKADETFSAQTLDALMDWQKYQAMTNSHSADEAEKLLDPRLLRLRAKNNQPVKEPEETLKISPDHGHPSSKLAGSVMSDNNIFAAAIELRPSFHDYMDDDEGYLKNSSLLLGRTKLNYIGGDVKKLRLDDFIVAEVSSFPALTRLDRNFSWTVSGGLTRPRDINCADCVAPLVHGGFGLTYAYFTALATGLAEYSSFFAEVRGQTYRAGPGLSLRAIVPLGRYLRFTAGSESIFFMPETLNKSDATLAYGGTDFETRAITEVYSTDKKSFSVFSLQEAWYF